jgi:DNA polymerase-3 subunit gamma/tau
MEQFVVSARKYRPQTFNDVVGAKKAITNTLLNAIDSNHLASALLFTGPEELETTCARILARKINQPGYDDPTEDFLMSSNQMLHQTTC